MLKHRVIPCLLLRNGGLVKTRGFADPKYVGDPINAIRIFNEMEVDELLVLDIMASKQHTEPDFELIHDIAGECFMPLCYGGGVATFAQAKRIFALGIEKISLQSAALHDLGVVTEIAAAFGNQAIVVSVDVKRGWLGKAKLFSAATGRTLDEPWLEFAQRAVAAGAGEILLNAVDRDGSMRGYDLELVQAAASALPVPVIAVGGAGSLSDFKQAVKAGAHAVSAGSMFVFQGPHRAVLINYPRYSELVNLLDNAS